MAAVEFKINGKAFSITSEDVSIETTLNSYIRNQVQLRGTKSLCLEGGCGACTVTVTGEHPVTRNVKTFAVNSCLVPILSCHGWDITTIEGIGNKQGYDRTQTRIVLFNGVQCGFCTPGMVMNMSGLLEANNGAVTQEQVERSFGGNICRCTGYRPILDGYKSLASNADPVLAKLCADIEDLKLCKTTGKKCAGSCKSKREPLNKLDLYFPANREWHKVYTVTEIFDIFSTIGTKKYMLVAGNTAHGVYRRDPGIEVFIDVSEVQDLRTYSYGAELEFGGGVTITELINICETAVTTRPTEFAILTEVIKTLNSFGSIQIRNTASVAGNLILKNQNNEFVSDLYVILETLNARITIVESGGRLTDLSPLNFLRLQMSHRVVLRIAIPSRSASFEFRSYKVLPRAQCAPPHLNAAFLFEFNAARTSVISARITYGGISAAFNRATATELFVIGRNLYTNDVFRSAVTTLQQEINAESTPPSVSAEYKNQVAISLFYRFVINTAPAGAIGARYQSGGAALVRGLSSGTQSFQTQVERYPLSQVMHRVDGFVQAGGETPFVNDIPSLPRELWAAVVQATNVHATISSINAADALLIPGVRHFYSASNIPGANSFISTSMGFAEELFCSGRVLFHGQAIGVILADTQELAIYAASLVTATYGPATDPVLTTLESVFTNNATSRIIPGSHNLVSTQTGTDIVYTVNGQFEMGSQFHFSLEPQTCIAIPTEDGLTLHPSTQWISLIQSSVAQVLRVPENRLNIETRRIGGGFGSKLTRASFAACVAALGAHLAQVPVRYVMTLESNMKVLGKRHACISNYLTHVNRDGKIQNLNIDYYSDLGSSRNDNVEDNLTRFIPNCYDYTTWNVQSNSVLTDTPSSTFTRSPGMLEGMAITENIMEHIAHEIGRDSTDVRLANIPDAAEIRTKFTDFLTSVEYTTRKSAIETFNANNRWIKRGIAAIPLEYRHIFFGQFQCIVSIHPIDGTVSISHGGIEMGQGITTRVCQVAAHTLSIPIFNVAVKPTNNLIGGNCSVSGGSITSDTVCMAVLNACQNLNERLAPIRQQFPSATFTQVAVIAQQRNIQLSELYLQPPAAMPDYHIYAFTCAEIEVDVLTGNFILRRVDILEDVGESYSPLADVGQIEGGFIMGLGLWLTEKYMYGVGGELLTNRSWNYLPPGANDIPVDFRVSFFKDSRNEKIILGSKIVGEPPVLMSIVGVFALRNALWSARTDAGLQYAWRSLKGPYTVENIFLTAGTNADQFVL